MNKNEKEIQDHLDAMPFAEARKTIRSGTLYTIGSPNHDVALSWLKGKEAELQELHNAEMIAITRKALPITDTFNSKKWYEKPLGMILIGVIASLLAGLLLYFYYPP